MTKKPWQPISVMRIKELQLLLASVRKSPIPGILSLLFREKKCNLGDKVLDLSGYTNHFAMFKILSAPYNYQSYKTSLPIKSNTYLVEFISIMPIRRGLEYADCISRSLSMSLNWIKWRGFGFRTIGSVENLLGSLWPRYHLTACKKRKKLHK